MKTLVTENKKHIPRGLRFLNSASIKFVEYNQDGLDYVFDYTEHKNGISVYFQNKDSFDEFPSCIEVVSGSWCGEDGRWSPLEKRIGQLRFTNVSKFNIQESENDSAYIKLSRGIFSKKIKVEIISSKLGSVVFNVMKLFLC